MQGLGFPWTGRRVVGQPPGCSGRPWAGPRYCGLRGCGVRTGGWARDGATDGLRARPRVLADGEPGSGLAARWRAGLGHGPVLWGRGPGTGRGVGRETGSGWGPVLVSRGWAWVSTAATAGPGRHGAGDAPASGAGPAFRLSRPRRWLPDRGLGAGWGARGGSGWGPVPVSPGRAWVSTAATAGPGRHGAGDAPASGAGPAFRLSRPRRWLPDRGLGAGWGARGGSGWGPVPVSPGRAWVSTAATAGPGRHGAGDAPASGAARASRLPRPGRWPRRRAPHAVGPPPGGRPGPPDGLGWAA